MTTAYQTTELQICPTCNQTFLDLGETYCPACRYDGDDDTPRCFCCMDNGCDWCDAEVPTRPSFEQDFMHAYRFDPRINS